MESTMDQAGRMVIPKAIRDAVGLRPGKVNVSVDGAGVRVEPPHGSGLVRQNGRLVIPPSGERLTDEDVRTLRDALQR